MDSIPLTSFTTATKQLVSTAAFTKKYGVKQQVPLNGTPVVQLFRTKHE